MASGDGGDPASRKLSEQELLRLETSLLGADHAAEHAEQRRANRRLRARRLREATAGHRAGKRGLAGRRMRGGAAAHKLLAAGPPSEVGAWRAGLTVPGVAINAALLPTGKVLYYPGRGYSYVGDERAFLYDPSRPLASGSNPRLVAPPSPAAWTIFCSGTSFLANGHVLAVGGQGARAATRGAPLVMTFDPFTERWTRRADMPEGRWYPGQVLLPNGLTAVMAGYATSGGANPRIEIYDAATGAMRLAATRGTSGAPPNGGMYPNMRVMPSGRVLVAGPEPGDSWLFSYDGSRFAWNDIANLATKRDWAPGVLLPGPPSGSTKVMLIAGRDFSDVTQSSSIVFDEANPGAGWAAAAPLKVGRGHHNTILLPDGSMVTVGGGFGSRNGNHYAADATHKQVELYDPATKTWKLGPSQAQRRAYHSVALLLPDGTVLSGGDDGPDDGGGSQTDLFEVYEPPYLHKTTASGDPVPRPTISGAPATIGYGQGFAVQSPDANVTRGVLIAPAATTHANDMNQRHVELTLARRGDGTGYDLVAPARSALAPPGYYMLFLLNDQGVPSVARFVRLGAGTTPPAPVLPGAPTIGTPTAGNASATVRWSAPASDGGAAISGYRVRTFAGGTQVGTTAQVNDGAATSTVISGLTNGTQYTFDVAAVNSVGQGPFSNRSAAVTPTGGGTAPTTRTVTLEPVADAMAKQAAADTAFAATTPLLVDSEDVNGNTSTRVTSYLRFAAPALAAGESITDAVLSVYVTNATTNGPQVWRTADSWTESNLTWNARPARSSTTAAGNFGAMNTANARASTAVSGITAAGDVSLELYAEVGDGLAFPSREFGTAANRPRLVLTIRSG